MTSEKQKTEERLSRLTGSERLSLLSLIDHGLWTGASNTPVASELFRNLWNLIDTTISGSKVSRLVPKTGDEGFSVIEVTGKQDEILGRLNLLGIDEPLPCYYLVYVEVPPLFRKKGLGTLILKNLKIHLDEQQALGILDNIIPVDDPSYSIYFKTGWKPVADIVGDAPKRCQNYMVYVPKGLAGTDLSHSVQELLGSLQKQRPTIDMRDNQQMVRNTIAEFRELHAALRTYFEYEIRENEPSPFMRYLFTRFVWQVMRFRRYIGELIGYTGGESMEQIELRPEVASLPIHPVAPKEVAHSDFGLWGDKSLCFQVLDTLGDEPAEAIEALPSLPRPRVRRFLAQHDSSRGIEPTVGDLMTLGFDPTTYKLFEMEGRKFTFERIQLRKINDIEKKQAIVEKLSPKLKGRTFGGARLRLNSPVLLLQDRGNAYLLRPFIEAIHWEEAVEQLRSNPRLQSLCESMGLDKLILRTVREANAKLEGLQESDRNTVAHDFAWFVPWDFEENEPKLFIDFEGPTLEAIWLL